jgi:hypothetical protein
MWIHLLNKMDVIQVLDHITIVTPNSHLAWSNALFFSLFVLEQVCLHFN